MGTKIIENVDDEVWQQFSGYCKMKNLTIGEKLNEVLKKFLKETIELK